MELIAEQYKNMIWHDELGEPFLLLKYAEVFEYSKTLLGLHCWSQKLLAVMRLKGLISFEMATDDPLFILRVDKCHLPLLVSLGAFKKRPDINGAWLKEKEKLLAHKILIYRPTFEKVNKDSKVNVWEKVNKERKKQLGQWMAKQPNTTKGA
jgi:hypothetical protein